MMRPSPRQRRTGVRARPFPLMVRHSHHERSANAGGLPAPSPAGRHRPSVPGGTTGRRSWRLMRPVAIVTPIAARRRAGVGGRRPIERGAFSALAGLRRRARPAASGGALRLRLRLRLRFRPGGGIAPRTPLPLRRGTIGFLLGVRRRVKWGRFRARFRRVRPVRRRRGRSRSRLAGRVSLDSRARLSRGVHRLLVGVRDAFDDRKAREEVWEELAVRRRGGADGGEDEEQRDREGRQSHRSPHRRCRAAVLVPLRSCPNDVSEQRAARPPLRLGRGQRAPSRADACGQRQARTQLRGPRGARLEQRLRVAPGIKLLQAAGQKGDGLSVQDYLLRCGFTMLMAEKGETSRIATKKRETASPIARPGGGEGPPAPATGGSRQRPPACRGRHRPPARTGRPRSEAGSPPAGLA